VASVTTARRSFVRSSADHACTEGETITIWFGDETQQTGPAHSRNNVTPGRSLYITETSGTQQERRFTGTMNGQSVRGVFDLNGYDWLEASA
jgi:hypothetical protein